MPAAESLPHIVRWQRGHRDRWERRVVSCVRSRLLPFAGAMQPRERDGMLRSFANTLCPIHRPRRTGVTVIFALAATGLVTSAIMIAPGSKVDGAVWLVTAAMIASSAMTQAHVQEGARQRRQRVSRERCQHVSMDGLPMPTFRKSVRCWRRRSSRESSNSVALQPAVELLRVRPQLSDCCTLVSSTCLERLDDHVPFS